MPAAGDGPSHALDRERLGSAAVWTAGGDTLSGLLAGLAGAWLADLVRGQVQMPAATVFLVLFALFVAWSRDQLASVSADIEGQYLAAIERIPAMAPSIIWLQCSTISLIVDELKIGGLLEEVYGESTGGRPPGD